ncbi:MAG: LrgB family protein [Oscillospiraceae bacterium]|nr:LrgB family protein [Oscillospiraceae bacterium]
MNEFLSASTYFAVTLALIVYAFADALQKKFKSSLLNPLVVSSVIVIIVLLVLDIPNEEFQAGCQVLNYLLTPATICLSISFYEKFQTLKRDLPAVIAGVLAGIVCSLGSVYILCTLFDVDRVITLSLLPKSVTTAIGLALSSEIGGITAITTVAICITGNIGNMLGPMLCKLFRIDDEIARGVAFGTSSHVIGTSKAMEMSQLSGAVSSLSLTIAGLVTCIVLSFLAQYI